MTPTATAERSAASTAPSRSPDPGPSAGVAPGEGAGAGDGHHAPALAGLRVAMAAVTRELGALDVDVLATVEAQELVPELAQLERRVAAVGVLCAARAAASVRRRKGGDRQAAEWLAGHTGRTTREAEAALHTADRVRGASGTRRAWLGGELTTDQAGQIARAVEFSPGSEGSLLDLAGRAPAEDLRREANAVVLANRAETPDERFARQHRNRRASTWTNDEGVVEGRFATTGVQGAEVVASLDLCSEAAFRRARRLGEHAPLAAHRMDGLALMAAIAAGRSPFDLGYVLDDLPAALRPAFGADQATLGEEGDGDPVAATGPYRPRGTDGWLGIVRIDLASLHRGEVHEGERCDIAGVGPVPLAQARAVLGEALLRFVITDGHDVVTVAHLSRRASAHQRTALLYRHDECTVAGCTSTVALQVDHDDPWAARLETWLPNLKPVCPHHHDRKTTQGWDWVVEPPDPVTGKHRLVPPHHPDHPRQRGDAKPRPSPGPATAPP